MRTFGTLIKNGGYNIHYGGSLNSHEAQLRAYSKCPPDRERLLAAAARGRATQGSRRVEQLNEGRERFLERMPREYFVNLAAAGRAAQKAAGGKAIAKARTARRRGPGGDAGYLNNVLYPSKRAAARALGPSHGRSERWVLDKIRNGAAGFSWVPA